MLASHHPHYKSYCHPMMVYKASWFAPSTSPTSSLTGILPLSSQSFSPLIVSSHTFQERSLFGAFADPVPPTFEALILWAYYLAHSPPTRAVFKDILTAPVAITFILPATMNQPITDMDFTSFPCLIPGSLDQNVRTESEDTVLFCSVIYLQRLERCVGCPGSA